MDLRVGGAIVVVCLVLGDGGAVARTWRVTPDGTGDAVNIEMAMYGSASGDTVLLAPGEHSIGPIPVRDGVVLRSEEGPLRTRVSTSYWADGGLACSGLDLPTEISGIWFEGFPDLGFTDDGVISILGCQSIFVHDCVFANNNKPGISVLSADAGVWIRIENNTFINNTFAVYADAARGATSGNIIWDSFYCPSIAMYVFCNDVLHLEDVPAGYGPFNFSLDPQFCSSTDFRLTESSPCVAGQSPRGDQCGLIGALPVNCTTVRTKALTWGAVKALYRD